MWYIKTISFNKLFSWLHTLPDHFLWLWTFWDILNENYSMKYWTRTPIQFSYTVSRRWNFKYVYFQIELWVLNVDVSCVTCSSTALSLRYVNCRDKTLYMQALGKNRKRGNYYFHKPFIHIISMISVTQTETRLITHFCLLGHDTLSLARTYSPHISEEHTASILTGITFLKNVRVLNQKNNIRIFTGKKSLNLINVHFVCEHSTSKLTPRSTDMRHLTTGIRSEKYVVRRFHRCANVIECTYTNLDSAAYYTASLYIVYCS